VFERAGLFVGNDSGLMHLAAAAGCPTLALFGPTDPRRYAPRGRKASFVQTERTFDFDAGTQPTSKADPDASGLMDTLAVTSVANAALDLLDRA
jgi:heptosyltransferase III